MYEKFAIVGIFAAALIVMSYLSQRRTRGYEDFNLAGRRLGFFRLVGTLGAAEFNTATLIGGASVAYLYGFVGLWYTSLIFIFVFGIYALTVAKPYRRLEISTIAEFFDQRFGGKLSEPTRALASFVTLTFTWIAPSTYLAGLAVITSVMLGIDPTVSIVVITVFCLGLAITGGFMTAVSLDIVAYAMILIFIPLLFVVAAIGAGGFGPLQDVFQPQFLSLEPVWDLENYGFALILTWGFQNIMLYIAAPWYGQRVFSARSEKIAYHAMIANTVLITVLYGLVVITTMLSRVALPDLDRPEEALPTLANDILPPIVQGLVLVTLLLVGVSTMVAIWNSAVSIVTNDFITRYFMKNPTDSQRIWASRWVFLVLGASTLFFALTFIGNILLALTYVSVFTALLAVPILAGLYWKRYTTVAALASLVSGTVYVSIALLAGLPYYMISPVGVALSAIIGIVVTLASTSRGEEDQVAEFMAIARGERQRPAEILETAQRDTAPR